VASGVSAGRVKKIEIEDFGREIVLSIDGLAFRLSQEYVPLTHLLAPGGILNQRAAALDPVPVPPL
jgi:hypothetical protein